MLISNEKNPLQEILFPAFIPLQSCNNIELLSHFLVLALMDQEGIAGDEAVIFNTNYLVTRTLHLSSF